MWKGISIFSDPSNSLLWFSHLLLPAHSSITQVSILASLPQTLCQPMVDCSCLLQLFTQHRVDLAEAGTPGNNNRLRDSTAPLLCRVNLLKTHSYHRITHLLPLNPWVNHAWQKCLHHSYTKYTPCSVECSEQPEMWDSIIPIISRNIMAVDVI